MSRKDSFEAEHWLSSYDEDSERRWNELLAELTERFGAEPSMEVILFLIGIEARGTGYEPEIPREEKQEIIMEGTRCVLENLGLDVPETGESAGTRDGSAEQSPLSDDENEMLLRVAVLHYLGPAARPGDDEHATMSCEPTDP